MSFKIFIMIRTFQQWYNIPSRFKVYGHQIFWNSLQYDILKCEVVYKICFKDVSVWRRDLCQVGIRKTGQPLSYVCLWSVGKNELS